VSDHFWNGLYVPIARGAERIARIAGLIQQRRIGVYLTVSFATLIVLLFLAR
jgi:hypothetical protein